MKKTPVFIHNPKAASTSIRGVISGIKTAKIGKGSPYRHIHQLRNTRFIENQLHNCPNPWLFGVVRHPLDRFVSAWAYFKTPRNRACPENYVLEAMLQEGSVNDFVLTTDFEKISKHIPHFRTQTQYFATPTGRRAMDQIIRFESIQEGFTTLCNELGIAPFHLPDRRSTVHDPWEDLLSPKSLEKLMRFYGVDFDNYGYEAS